jgi:hypothetical protein
MASSRGVSGLDEAGRPVSAFASSPAAPAAPDAAAELQRMRIENDALKERNLARSDVVFCVKPVWVPR